MVTKFLAPTSYQVHKEYESSFVCLLTTPIVTCIQVDICFLTDLTRIWGLNSLLYPATLMCTQNPFVDRNFILYQ